MISLTEAQELHELVGSALEGVKDGHTASVAELERARELAALIVSDLLAPKEPIQRVIAREFVARCPVGWAIDSGFEGLERTGAGWRAHGEGEEFRDVTAEEAADHLLNEQGFEDYEGIHDLVERMRTGGMGGGM